jgi:hypothetical protein
MLIVTVVGSLATAVTAAVGRLRVTTFVFALIAALALLLGGLAWAYSARHDTSSRRPAPVARVWDRDGQ